MTCFRARSVIGRRTATLCVAIAVCGAFAQVAAASGRHRRPATVHCVRGGGPCVTHFLVDVAGSQVTTWKFPYQRVGAADCYQVPYRSGHGQQQIDFSGTGVTEAIGSAQMRPTFEYLLHGTTQLGIGHGPIHLQRTASLMIHIDPGPCGSTKDVGDHETAHGCGGSDWQASYDLTYTSLGEVALSTGLAGPGPTGVSLDGCPLLATGTPDMYGSSSLYSGFSEKLPASELFNGKLGKIILFGGRTFSARQPSLLGVTGQTSVHWTITLTRIAHSVFPITPAPLGG